MTRGYRTGAAWRCSCRGTTCARGRRSTPFRSPSCWPRNCPRHCYPRVAGAHTRLVARYSLLVASAVCLLVSQSVWLAYADPPAPAPGPIVAPLAPGQVLRIGPTAGTGTPTKDYGLGAPDLCEC